MTIQILTPLIQEYVKSGGISDQDMLFLVQTGKDLNLDEDSVKALVSIEQERLKPSNREPASLLIPLVRTVVNGSKVPDDSVAELKQVAAAINIDERTVQALVALHQGSLSSREASPLALVHQLVVGLARGKGLSPHSIDFIQPRGREVGLPDAVTDLLVQLEMHRLGQHTASALVLFGDLIQASATAKPLAVTDKLFLENLGKELGLPAEAVYALLEIHNPTTEPIAYEGERLSLLIKALVKYNLLNDPERALVGRIAHRLSIAEEIVDSLLRFEVAIAQQQAPVAQQLINLVIRALGGTNNLSVTQSAFITSKLLEVSNVEKATLARKQVEDALRRKASERDSVSAEKPKEATEAARPLVPSPPSSPTPPSRASGPGTKLSETQLYLLPEGRYNLRKSGLFSHPKGYTYFIIMPDAQASGAGTLVINGIEVDANQIEELIFSPNGKYYAYKLKKKEGEVVVFNGRPSEPFDNVGQLKFNHDGSSFAHLAKRGKYYHLVHDGHVGIPYPGLREFAFQPATNRIALVAFQNMKWNVVFGGETERGFGLCGELAFSPDGNQLAYWARQGNLTFAVRDGKPEKAFQGVGDFIWSHDSKHLAYVAGRNGKFSVVQGEDVGPTYDKVWSLTFSPASDRLAYLARAERKEFAVVAGRQEKSFDSVSSFRFSSEGKHYAYEAKQGNHKIVIKNSNPSPPYDELARITFNPQSQQLAYHAYFDKHWYVVVDGGESEPFSDVDELVFSQDGVQFAFWAKIKNDWAGIINTGWRDGDYPNAKHLVFSKDGMRLAFVYFKKDGWYFVVDKQTMNTTPYSEILQPPRFDDQKNQFYMLVRVENEVRLVTCL